MTAEVIPFGEKLDAKRAALSLTSRQRAVAAAPTLAEFLSTAYAAGYSNKEILEILRAVKGT